MLFAEGVAMCTERIILKGETVSPGIFKGAPIMKKLRGLHQRFAKTRLAKSTSFNGSIWSTLLRGEALKYARQMRRAMAEYWELGKKGGPQGAPNSVPTAQFAATFTEWRRQQMASRATRAQSEKASWRLLCQIAETIDNPSLLSALASHECSHVRAAVADNVHTYLETLSLLTADDDADVRYAVAENHNIPIAILERLVEDENPYVASRAQRTIARLKKKEVVPAIFPKAIHKHRRAAFA